MPRSNLPQTILFAKNRIDNQNAWLVLLGITVPLQPEPLRIYVVNNNENIFFGTPPVEYTAAPFSVALPKQASSGEVGKTMLHITDADKILRSYLEALNGGYGTTVKMTLVESSILDDASDYVDLTFDFDLLDASIDGDEISIGLGAPNMLRQAFPPMRYLANHCAWTPYYGGPECKLSVAIRETYPACPGTRAACRIRNNTANFGGFPGLADSSIKLA